VQARREQKDPQPSAISSAICWRTARAFWSRVTTTKALRMVRHHIVPELRPCASASSKAILDSRKQLRAQSGRSRSVSLAPHAGALRRSKKIRKLSVSISSRSWMKFGISSAKLARMSIATSF